MKHLIYLLLLVGSPFLILAKGTPDLPTVDEIIDRHAEAMGGKNAWKQLKGWTIVCTTEEGRRTTALAAYPNQFKLVFEGEGAAKVKGYDGKRGWIEQDGKIVDMDPGEAAEMAEEPEFYQELMFARENGYGVKLKGEEEWQGKKVWKIEVKKSKTDVQTYYLNAESYLIEAVSETSEDPKWKGSVFTTYFKDFRSVDGLQFPFAWGLQVDEKGPKWRDVLDVELNPAFYPGTFDFPASGGPDNSKALLRKLQKDAQDLEFDRYTFIQTTIRFQKDGSPRDTSTWHEALLFPDRFRIDFGPLENKTAVIYRNDSSFFFRKGELMRSGPEYNELLLLEGGVATYSYDTLVARMERFGYDLDKFHLNHFHGEPVYVIGAEPGDLESKQVWLHRNLLATVRRLDPAEEGPFVEVIFDDFVSQGGAWIETWVEFYLDGQLYQTERYNDIDTKADVKEILFDPNQFGEWHWAE